MVGGVALDELTCNADFVCAVEGVWKELEQAGRLPTTQSKCA